MLKKERDLAASAWPFVLAVVAASRHYYLVAGALLVGVIPPKLIHVRSADSPFGTMPTWSHYDGEHYATAALHGYAAGGNAAGASPAFFPLYPLLVRIAAESLSGLPQMMSTRSCQSVL
jgi:hypothetical protein